MRKKKHIIASVAFLCAALMAHAAPPKKLRFQSVLEIAPLMLSIPAPFDLKDIPRQPPEVKRYRISNGADSWTEDRVATTDLWLEGQFVGAWIDPEYNYYTVSKITHKFPSAFDKRPEVMREDFQRLYENTDLTLDKNADISDLTLWMSHFTGMNMTAQPELVRVNTSRLARLYEFKMEDERMRAFAFRLETGYPGQAKAPPHYFALVLSLVSQPDYDTLRVIRSDLLGNIGSPGAFAAKRNPNFAKNRTKNPNLRVIDSASRERAKRVIEYLADWWYKESQNYILISNNKMAEAIAETILGDLENLRPAFAKVAPPFADAEDMVGVVRLFNTEDEYVTYMSEADLGMGVERTGGVFDSSRRELVIRPTGSASSQTEGSVRSITKHEGTHQYLYAAFGGVTPSAWYNEGLATFFEICEFERDGTVKIKEAKRHADILENLVRDRDNNGNWADILMSFASMDYRQFYAGNAEVNYALAYGLMYYMILGAPLEANKPFAKFLPTYHAELERTASRDQATAAAFGAIDINRLANAFVEFWKSPKKRADALKNQKWK